LATVIQEPTGYEAVPLKVRVAVAPLPVEAVTVDAAAVVPFKYIDVFDVNAFESGAMLID